ncbi:MAG: ACP S-malonyltransferase [Verrucomicrobiota bacterium]
MPFGLMFSGQGAQAVGMGHSLYKSSAIARELYDHANEVLGFDLKEASFYGPEETLTETRVCQPALFLQGYATVEILKHLGKVEQPSCCLGLSLGELTALSTAGVFDFATGLQLVEARGRLMQEACDETAGGMVVLIGGERASAFELANEADLDVANLNCPGQIVLSGEKANIPFVLEHAKSKGFKMAKELNVAGAYHSRLMQSAAEAYESVLAPIEFKAPVCPVYTNTTGKQISEPEAIKAALVKQITGSVYYEDCMRNAVNDTQTMQYLECGPGGILAGLAKRTDRKIEVRSLGEYVDITSKTGETRIPLKNA